MGFQKTVGREAIGTPGDIGNVQYTLALPTTNNGWIAGTENVTVGRFCWDKGDGFSLTNVQPVGAPAPLGVIARGSEVADIGAIGQEGTLNIIKHGCAVTVVSRGLMLCETTENFIPNQQVYILPTNGEVCSQVSTGGMVVTGYDFDIGFSGEGISFGATPSTQITLTTTVLGQPTAGETITGAGIPAGTTVTAYADNLVTISAPATVLADTVINSFGSVLNVYADEVGAPPIGLGYTVTGVGVAPGTTILMQDSGTPNGAGVYLLTTPATASVADPVIASQIIDNVVADGWFCMFPPEDGLVGIQKVHSLS